MCTIHLQYNMKNTFFCVRYDTVEDTVCIIHLQYNSRFKAFTTQYEEYILADASERNLHHRVWKSESMLEHTYDVSNRIQEILTSYITGFPHDCNVDFLFRGHARVWKPGSWGCGAVWTVTGVRVCVYVWMCLCACMYVCVCASVSKRKRERILMIKENAF